MPKKSYYCDLVGCVYHTAREAHQVLGDCNYMDVTGHSKLGRMSPEERKKWRNGEIICPCYLPEEPQPGKKRQNNDYVFARKARKDRIVERKLYDAGMNDHEIARALGLCSNAIWVWRQKEGLPPNAGVGAPKRKEETPSGQD